MQWFYANKWLFDGIGAIVIVGVIGFLLKRYVFTERTDATVVRDSHLTGSPVASGSQITQHNYFSPAAPQPVIPSAATTPPRAAEANPQPNILMTRAMVYSVNEFAPATSLVEDRTGRAQAFVVEFTNEARHTRPTGAATVKASLVYEHNYEHNDTAVLRTIGSWKHNEIDMQTFEVEDTHQLVVGILLEGEFRTVDMRSVDGYMRPDLYVVPPFETVRVRLTRHNGVLLYEGRFRVTLDPPKIVPDITGQGDVTLFRST